jgi:hypothetical protein
MSNPNPLGREHYDFRGKEVPMEVKEFIAKDVIAKNNSGTYWDNRYNFPRNSSCDWARQLRKRGHLLPQGGQFYIPSEGFDELEEMVKDTHHNVRTEAYDKRMDQIAKDHVKDHLGRDLPDDYSYSRRSKKRVDEYLGTTNQNAERDTKARAAAVSDIRNLASFAAANHFMHSIANTNLFINSDATTIQVGGDLKKKYVLRQ